jgi:hypothetical protein
MLTACKFRLYPEERELYALMKPINPLIEDVTI